MEDPEHRGGRPSREARTSGIVLTILVLLLLLASAPSPATTAKALPPVEELTDGIALRVGEHRLEVRACRENVVRVLFAPPGPFFERETLMRVADACRPTEWRLQVGRENVAVLTSRLKARVDRRTGAVSFFDAEGRPLAREHPGGGKTLTAATVQGEPTHHVRLDLERRPGEALYGLGQHQHGWLDIAGRDVDLVQHNTVAVVPFLVSSEGWGLLWDNTSHSRFGDLRDPAPIPTDRILDAEGRPGAWTGTYRQGSCEEGRIVGRRRDPAIDFGAPEDRPPITAVHQAPQATNADLHPSLPEGDACVVWEGSIVAGAAGSLDLWAFSSDGLRLEVDGELLVDTWRQGWLPWWDTRRLEVEEGSRHDVRLEWTRQAPESTMRLLWKPPPRPETTTLWSEVGDGIDYSFVFGPDLDEVVAGYRELTGRAPRMPRWALGLWQSRERYETAAQSVDVVEEFRRRRIPLDVIVQDWRYWEDDAWGSHEFDAARFPDPEGWIDRLHALDARVMISVWPKFYPGTRNFAELAERGFLYPETLRRPTTDWLGFPHSFYDAFDPEARGLFWSQIERELLEKGVDAWWMDATEPELVGEGTAAALKASMHPTALGSGARMANAYALVNSRAIWEGERRARPDRRVFILTRSAFAGIQRYSSATWSGDVSASWDSLRRQIPAGLSFTLSGVPWWTTDVGGFAVPRKWSRSDPTPEDVEEWRELNTRWFQYATFLPLLRSHGQAPPREMWHFGGGDGAEGDGDSAAYRAQLRFTRLRYRLLPYVDSVAARVTRDHGSLMRALVTDFRDDPAVRDVPDQFLFGPSLMVSPVIRFRARSREVVLPVGTEWVDFWTGRRFAGGQRIVAEAPLDAIPVHVRAGSIVPFGPELQFTDEKPADPLTLWVYTGADAAFEIAEDDGTSFDAEEGAFATIPVTWDEADGELRIGARTGAFPGMPTRRTIRAIFVRPGTPVGFDPLRPPDAEIVYTGEAVSVTRSEIPDHPEDEGTTCSDSNP